MLLRVAHLLHHQQMEIPSSALAIARDDSFKSLVPLGAIISLLQLSLCDSR